MQKQNGFTLVELVVVIIILGILAVTAAPKFINMQSDARVSTLQGVKGAINGANVMVYAKTSLKGANNKDSYPLTIDGIATPVSTVYGYVAGTSGAVTAVASLESQDWTVTDNNAGTVTIQQKNAPTDCTLTYTQASSGALPSFGSIPDASKC